MYANQFQRIAWVSFALGVGLLSSCRDRSTPPSGSGGETAAIAPGTPLETARLLHDLHEAREYGKIAQLITEERRAATLKLLIALDDAVAANADLRRTAESAYFGPQSEYWDLASMENNLGVFSRKVAFISVSYRGDEAVVSLQQGDSVPVIHVAFVLRKGAWLLSPDRTPGQLPSELNELARLIREVESDVARGVSLNAYVDAFFYRVVPQMKRIVTAGHADQPVMTAWTPDAD